MHIAIVDYEKAAGRRGTGAGQSPSRLAKVGMDAETSDRTESDIGEAS